MGGGGWRKTKTRERVVLVEEIFVVRGHALTSPQFFLEFLNFFPRQICRSDVYYWGELVIYEPGGREVEMARIKRKRKRNPATDRWDVKLKQMKKNFHVLACARPWRLEANERLFFQRQGKCSAFSSTQTHTRN